MSDRVPYFDALRGLAIFAVVAIHTSGEGLTFDSDSLNFIYTVLWRQITNCAVPLFVTLSGYFMAKKYNDNLNEYTSYLKKQIPKIYIPMLCWSILTFTLAISVHHRHIMKEIVKLVAFQSTGAYYFIALIIQYYILLPLLKRYLNNIRGLFISAAISILWSILIYYIRYYTHILLPLIFYAGLFPTWIVFFMAGLYWGSRKPVPIRNRWLVPGVMVSYLLSCLETYWLYGKFGQAGYAVTAVKPTAIIYSFFIISLFFNNIGFSDMKIMVRIGQVSFGIYLIHMYFIPHGSKLLKAIPLLFDIQPFYQLGLIAFTLLCSYTVICLSRKILSDKILKWIGF